MKFIRPAHEAEFAPVSGQSGLVEALLFEVGDLGRVGYTSRTGTRSFCCSQELVARTGCNPGHIIIRPRSGDKQVSVTSHPR